MNNELQEGCADAGSSLTEEQVQFYSKEGCLVVPALLTKEDWLAHRREAGHDEKGTLQQ